MTTARCLFVSDLHLDQHTHRLNEAFARFMDAEARTCDEIYLLGDLVEVWVGDDDDSAFAESLRARLHAAARRCDVYVMHGNRDFLVGSRLCRETGVRLIADPHLIGRNGRRILLSHGDAFCTRDHAYQQMRALFRSETWQADIMARSLAERRDMARALRAQSMAANANKSENIMDVTDGEVESAAQRHAADVLVHGHTHRPGVHDHRVDGRMVRRFVLGDWDRVGWAVRVDATGMRLVRFRLGAVAP
jgi:UDP-2,3-diacylglucosamine hydrolase